jgi:transcriptional regulator with XRE-family HTH domain
MEPDMFEPVRDAGITQGELAAIANVSRLTVNKWMRGKFSPHKLHKDKIDDLIFRIKLCVEKGALPVSPRLKGEERKQTIYERVNGVM